MSLRSVPSGLTLVCIGLMLGIVAIAMFKSEAPSQWFTGVAAASIVLIYLGILCICKGR